MQFVYNDGGRAKAGFKGLTGDCVTRAIAIATGRPYQEVYNSLFEEQRNYVATKRDRLARGMKDKGFSPRNGVARKVYEKYLLNLGWKFVPTMAIGSGCKVHLKARDLPKGRLICRVSKHLTVVIDHVIQDTYDCSRGETRCVYGYFVKA